MELPMMMNLNDPSELSKLLNTACKKEISDILRYFLQAAPPDELSMLACRADEIREKYYGRKVYFRGLIEFSSYCRNDCYYCGIRRGNSNARRYRLSDDEIFQCCSIGYGLGYRTFVLQSGEDLFYTDERMCHIVSAIKGRFPDSAITLSIGERSRESYRRLFDAGVERYLLRHETADEAHYGKLHPPEIGAGFMVDSPDQTYDTLAEDFLFLRKLQPHMVGIGPFIPHKYTKFAGYYKPSSKRTLILLSLLRLLLPKVLLPATTALGTIDPLGREKGFQASANVVMPNLSPTEHRRDYALYDNKICMGEEAAECFSCLAGRIRAAGFVPDFSRGDHIDREKEDLRVCPIAE
jgi:biotin synthase